MRKRNPIYEKARWTMDRSRLFLGGVMGFAAVMTLFAFVVFYDMLRHMRVRQEGNFAQMLQMYIVLGMIECLLVLLVSPGISGASVAGERDRGMYDILRVSGVGALRLISGKITACMNVMIVLIVAGFPALSLVFVYGGVRLVDAVTLGAVLVLIALYLNSAGLLCSVLLRKTGRAVAASYAVMLFLTAGTLLIHYLPSFLFVSGYGEAIGSQIDWFHYLLLLNPLLTFYCVLNSQAGSKDFMFSLINDRGNYRPNWVTEHWTGVSLTLFAVLSIAALLLTAVLQRKFGRKR